MSVISLHSILLVAAVAHIVITAVMALFARHKVQYLSLAWIMGIFAAALLLIIPFAEPLETLRPVMWHPATLVGLMAFSYLQSIYPLGITMPGYLQWKRMVRYVLPVVIIGFLYGILTLLGMTSPEYYTWGDILANAFTLDMLLRLSMLCVSVYYIINIFRLPRTSLHIANVPGYLFGYAIVLGLTSCYYLWLTTSFTVLRFEIWLVLFTCENLYMCFRVLESLALTLPQPKMMVVEEAPEPEPATVQEDDEDDFNELNLRRFERVEYWMQHHHDEWKDYTFGRDQLCTAVGLNRHLLLQSVRSQGYYNIHEYINTYRIAELQRMIARGEVRTLTACQDAGFGTVKTARSCFEKVTGTTLDDYLAKHK
ncbi:MAG: hypothetical protein IJQ59_00495 [Bacteroidaceae bacterium]|nr:hypothetical protein [Bacteroidaceae bacterium]